MHPTGDMSPRHWHYVLSNLFLLSEKQNDSDAGQRKLSTTEERTETVRRPMCFKRKNGGLNGEVFVSKRISLPFEPAQGVAC